MFHIVSVKSKFINLFNSYDDNFHTFIKIIKLSTYNSEGVLYLFNRIIVDRIRKIINIKLLSLINCNYFILPDMIQGSQGWYKDAKHNNYHVTHQLRPSGIHFVMYIF